jgi:hypothetical protein
MPTGFVAEIGSGKPVIAILGEFDALPGLSQEASPLQKAIIANASGHGCGHNLFGVGSARRGDRGQGVDDGQPRSGHASLLWNAG